MRCVAKCADGEFVSVPECAEKHMEFFRCLRDAHETEFWAEKESEVPWQASDLCFVPGLRVPVKTFHYEDKDTGKKCSVRFTVNMI